MSELAREFLMYVHTRANDRSAKRECWSYTRGEVTLTLGLGPGVGFALWTDGTEWITTGGLNEDPVTYETDEDTTEDFPAGCEHPIEVIIGVLERFVEHADRSSDVGWASFRAASRRE
ncbi:Imm1 family immunity protein [Lentzea sp. NPDC006480]|uniref:Imm1 family immunity protein n=1 Tax=Lentzea sp. NPDC006480 TaxID=3157176 RepID=UPI00339EBD4D